MLQKMFKNYTKKKISFLCLILAFSFNSIVYKAKAEGAFEKKNAYIKQYGVSMHDTPKLKTAGESLTYTNTNAPHGGKLKQAAIGTFDTLNPFNIKGTAAARGLNLIYDRLTLRSWDEPFTLYPLIAENIYFSEDRRRIKIILNEKAKFNSGAPITADDVLFTFHTLKHHGRPNMRNVYKLVDEYRIIDIKTLEITLSRNSDRETAMILAMMPVLSKKYWESQDFNSSLTEPPLSSGPYLIKDFEFGRNITYKRNPDYWAKNLPLLKGLYNFDEVKYDYYRDDDIALMAFNAGDLNLRKESNITKWVTGYEHENAKSKKIIKTEISHGRPEKAHSIIFNTRKKQFKDLMVRKALSHLIDFEWINKNLYHKKLRRNLTFFPNSAFYNRGRVTNNQYDILRGFEQFLPKGLIKNERTKVDYDNKLDVRKHYKHADFMLRQAGWDIVEGKRFNSVLKQPFTFEILVNNNEDEKIALTFKRSLKRLGIVPTIRKVDMTTYQGRIRSFDYDVIIGFWRTSLSPGTEQNLYWSCEAAEIPSQWNYSGICSPAIDHVISELTKTTSYESLIDHMQALDKLLVHNYIAIPLLHKNKDLIAHTENLEKPKKEPLYGAVLESWWEKTEK